MKQILLIAAAFVSSIALAQTDCKPYVPAEEGTLWEISNYNAKGKLNGRIVYELKEKIVNGDDMTFVIHHSTYDKKGKELYNSSFEAHCISGKFKMDMTYKMDGARLAGYDNMEVDVDASDFEIPDMQAAAGTALADGTLKVAVGGGIGLNMTVDITDRLIENHEQMTTAAGTFDCIVLSQKVSTKMIIGVKGSSKEWYAENVGMVRSESYNKKGKMIGYSELTRLETN